MRSCQRFSKPPPHQTSPLYQPYGMGDEVILFLATSPPSPPNLSIIQPNHQANPPKILTRHQFAKFMLNWVELPFQFHQSCMWPNFKLSLSRHLWYKKAVLLALSSCRFCILAVEVNGSNFQEKCTSTTSVWGIAKSVWRTLYSVWISNLASAEVLLRLR